ncbi:hypothetical protein BWI93_24985 [Siphonobacter sp. BAB-5385]|uniref:hypothetical protein n=1 Tax=Siphonobacter sp. BAB-5385 TaxID=1864822 RepID=UPI000B9EAAD6|nr:hypothetical protein [Siphonobacter sp. BAB-5385]OZI05523.1 hypothetical protein BWI93_24985 [Siphonobacter sp. BAB-5385]
MNSKARDVTGGREAWGSFIPGYFMVNYFLRWCSVPVETLLRRDFGERYYTKSNFIAGLLVLLFIQLIGYLFSVFTSFIPSFGGGGDYTVRVESRMGSVTKWYFIIGLLHFVTIWVRNIIGSAKHSYASGKSWLLIIGKFFFRVVNLGLEKALLFVAKFLPDEYAKRIKESFPILRDYETFTERFIEPLTVFICMLMAFSMGQTAVGYWLMLSFMALNLVTGERHEASRNFILNLRDQMLEGEAWRKAMLGQPTDEAKQISQTLYETMREVEKTPEILETIRQDQPRVANAIAAIRARKNKRTNSLDDGAAVDMI